MIEALEIDDFLPCGGDFYARGHLRTLARVLGLDAAPLPETYAERYADAPVDPRRVFEAEHGRVLYEAPDPPTWLVQQMPRIAAELERAARQSRATSGPP